MSLVFDFDGTITQEDTISELANAAIGFQRANNARDLEASWDQVVKAYMDDCTKSKAEYPIQEENRRTVDDEMQFMGSMKSVELASLDRIKASGLFQGLRSEDLYQMGVDARVSGRIKIRDGFRELFDLATERQWTVSIISVNWSSSFIRGALHDYDIPAIIANEPSATGEIEGPSILSRPLTDASGKLEALNVLAPGPSSKLCCYFGDSVTDLACVIRQIGVVMCSESQSSKLLSTLGRLGQDCPHVSARNNIDTHDLRRQVYWARDFREVSHSGVLEKVTSS